MGESNEKVIASLQDNLSMIRKIAGWTTDELGKRIGVTKQTISNLENKKTKMTLTQYIAIRTVLDYEIQSNPENTTLAQVVDILLNHEGEYSKEEQKKLKKTIEVIAAAAVGGASYTSLASMSTALLTATGITLGGPIVAGAVLVGSTLWMPKVIKKITKKK